MSFVSEKLNHVYIFVPDIDMESEAPFRQSLTVMATIDLVTSTEKFTCLESGFVCWDLYYPAPDLTEITTVYDQEQLVLLPSKRSIFWKRFQNCILQYDCSQTYFSDTFILLSILKCLACHAPFDHSGDTTLNTVLLEFIITTPSVKTWKALHLSITRGKSWS